MQTAALEIRDVREDESGLLGRLMVAVYSGLEGFPGPEEQPRYYEMLAHVGDFATRPGTRVLVARLDGSLVGGVVYFGDMAEYGPAAAPPVSGTRPASACWRWIRPPGVPGSARR